MRSKGRLQMGQWYLTEVLVHREHQNTVPENTRIMQHTPGICCRVVIVSYVVHHCADNNSVYYHEGVMWRCLRRTWLYRQCLWREPGRAAQPRLIRRAIFWGGGLVLFSVCGGGRRGNLGTSLDFLCDATAKNMTNNAICEDEGK